MSETSNTLYSELLRLLMKNGMPEHGAKAVLSGLAEDEAMAESLFEPSPARAAGSSPQGYPEACRAALKWIDENDPKAWYRNMLAGSDVQDDVKEAPVCPYCPNGVIIALNVFPTLEQQNKYPLLRGTAPLKFEVCMTCGHILSDWEVQPERPYNWTCPECESFCNWPYARLAIDGGPVCPNCDIDMVLDDPPAV